MHFKAESLRIPKHPRLLFLAQNLGVLRPSKQGIIFCGTPCRIANVCLSVSLSVTKIPKPLRLRIKPICHYAYLLISQIPISHHANQLSCQSATMPPPLSHYANQQLFLILSAIIMPIGYYIYQVSIICPAFAISKPLRLVLITKYK